jgi:hypothetical protein
MLSFKGGPMDAEIRAELHDLSVRYAAAADYRDVESFVDVFAEDATLIVHNGDSVDEISGNGLGRIPELLRRYDRTFHSLGQARYWSNESGQTAGEILCTASHMSDRKNFVMYIRYQDTYQKGGDGRWRIQYRDVQVQWTETREVNQ